MRILFTSALFIATYLLLAFTPVLALSAFNYLVSPDTFWVQSAISWLRSVGVPQAVNVALASYSVAVFYPALRLAAFAHTHTTRS